MELTRKQFDILAAFAAAKEKLSQRQLEEKCGYSLGTVNKTVKEMTELGYVNEGEITPLGIDALEPYRAEGDLYCRRLWKPHGASHPEHPQALDPCERKAHHRHPHRRLP